MVRYLSETDDRFVACPSRRRGRGFRGSALVVGLVAVPWTVGCEGGPGSAYELLRAEDARTMSVLAVPVVKQSKPRACGAAAMEMVLRYYSKPAGQQEIMNEIDRGDPAGLSARDMAALAKRRGLQAYSVHGKIEELFEKVDRQIPLIVARRTKYIRGMGNHYMVLVGHSADREYLVLNDPQTGQVRVRQERFLADWSEAQRFLMIVAPEEERTRSRFPLAP
jgi:ABC-type bacteriocin/lantibiotic exporter with double-glycine peptidase domain